MNMNLNPADITEQYKSNIDSYMDIMIENAANALAEEITKTATQIGKIFYNPTDGYKGLLKIGVTFMNWQIEILENKDVSDYAKQCIILDELKKEFGDNNE